MRLRGADLRYAGDNLPPHLIAGNNVGDDATSRLVNGAGVGSQVSGGGTPAAVFFRKCSAGWWDCHCPDGGSRFSGFRSGLRYLQVRVLHPVPAQQFAADGVLNRIISP